MKIASIYNCMVLVFICCAFNGYAQNETRGAVDIELPKIGNFSVPPSQQPGPLISFGQTNIDKNQQQFFLLPQFLEGEDQRFTILSPDYVYGITDDLAFLFDMHFNLRAHEGMHRSSGLDDTLLQLEYSYYYKAGTNYFDSNTVLGGVILPTGSSEETPPTGFGAAAFFLGTTFSRTYFNWYLFTSEGLLLTTANNKKRFGNQFFYQAGIGRKVFSQTDKYLFMWLLEVDGTYFEKDSAYGITDPNSGGNIILVTPSLWLSTKTLTLQLGAGLYPVQNLFGEQNKNKYLLIGSIAYTLDP